MSQRHTTVKIFERVKRMFKKGGKGGSGSDKSSNKDGKESKESSFANGTSTDRMNDPNTTTSSSKPPVPPQSLVTSNNNRLEPSANSVTQGLKDIRIEDESKKDHQGSRKGKQAISYAAERVIGNGSFGVVYQANIIETGETVAIKKVLQDRRFKNRELQIMKSLNHPCVVALKNSFLAKGEKPDDVYLNLVMEFIPETIYRTLRNHTKAKKLVPIMYTKVYMFQVCRSIAYIHSLGICHRDIKPQNLLLNPQTHQVKLCDFGSAKVLAKGQPNVSYICSRYYRAPELVFEATEYTSAIDIWSMGCVMAELLLGKPLFPGDSGVDQLIEIIKILGTPTREEIFAMNPHHTSFSFPQIAPHPWHKVFKGKCPKAAIDLVSKFLVYKPMERLDPFESLAHPFFDDIRAPDARLPNGKPLPSSCFDFSKDEVARAIQLGLYEKLFPPQLRHYLPPDAPTPSTMAPNAVQSSPAAANAPSTSSAIDVGAAGGSSSDAAGGDSASLADATEAKKDN